MTFHGNGRTVNFHGLLTCADSRTPRELIFDQGRGDMFVVRIAGNFQNDTIIGTFEYGVETGVVSILDSQRRGTHFGIDAAVIGLTDAKGVSVPPARSMSRAASACVEQQTM
ncbi:MAG: hypothetical protein DWI10_02290 [Planctomycetota bacterium]|nr:MAG: hypothetical protein DWI10_02290 [Planctomycetota bacterium]